MRHWAEAAVGRRNLARALRNLAFEGFEVRDLLADGDACQHSDRLLVGPPGVYVTGFRNVPSNVWRPRTKSGATTLAEHTRATARLAEIVGASLLPCLNRWHVGVQPLLTVIGPEQAAGAVVGGVPVLGPLGLAEHLTAAPRALSGTQVAALMDRVDDWLARQSVNGMRGKARAGGRGRSGAL